MGMRSGNPSFFLAMKLRTSRLGNQRKGRGEYGSTADGAVPGTGGGLPRLGADGASVGRRQRRADARDSELVRTFAPLAPPRFELHWLLAHARELAAWVRELSRKRLRQIQVRGARHQEAVEA